MLRHVIMAILLAGCTAAPVSSAPVSSAPAAEPPSAGGCSKSARLEPGRHTLTFGGLKRRFLLSVPKGEGPHPVLLDLHGLGSSAAQQAAYSRLPEVGSKRGYIVATPQAAEGRLGWTLPHTYGPDDTGFLGALLDHLEDRLCADRRREFAAGMSYGAGMSTGLVCAMNGRLAGIAPVSGVNIVQPCAEAEPTTIIAFHGTADDIVPYQGGHPLQNSSGQLRVLADMVVLKPVEQVVDGWARVLGCTGRTTSALSSQVRLRGWKSCRDGASVRLYTVKGGGHTWPGPIQVPRLGTTARDLDATDLILDTFDRTPSR